MNIFFFNVSTATKAADDKDTIEKKTRFSLISCALLDEPLIALISIFGVILKKDLNATLFQITIYTMLRPSLALLSFYWGAGLSSKRYRLRSNLLIAGIFQYAPIFLFPLVSSSWGLILGVLLFFLFQRAGIPAFMEILKINIEKSSRRKRLFFLCTTVGYTTGIILAIWVGKYLEIFPHGWRWLFSMAAALGLLGTYLKYRLPIAEKLAPPPSTQAPSLPLLDRITTPWKESYELLKSRPDFYLFQKGFMICGFGLMLLAPAIPSISGKESYFDCSIAMILLKGVGFILGAPVWPRLLEKFSIYFLTRYLSFLFGLYSLFLLLSFFHISFFYSAFLLYGIAQAGSKNIWYLSGPIFAKSEDSSMFSTVNILTTGLRGIIAPICGSLLIKNFGPATSLIAATGCCFYGSYVMLKSEKKYDLPILH